MNHNFKRFVCFLLAAMIPILCLSGCWDNQELNSILLITGVGLDASEKEEGMLDVSVQLFQLASKGDGGGDGGGGGGGDDQSTPLVLKSTAPNFRSALTDFRKRYYHQFLLQHNQVLLIGTELAEKGVTPALDVFTRKQDTRMEVSLIVVDGKAEEPLSAELQQEKVTGVFLANYMNELAQKSIHYRVRLLDFISRLLDKSSAPVAPIIKVIEGEDGQELTLSGLAVFKTDKMIGRLEDDEATSYVWAMGGTKDVVFTASQDDKSATFHINHLDCKRKITVEDQNVHVDFKLHAHISLLEMNHFSFELPTELIAQLTELAQAELQSRIVSAFEKSLALNADIYGIGLDIHRRFPKKWEKIRDNWEELFPTVTCTVTVNAVLQNTGQVVNSLNMEEQSNEN